MVTDTDPTGIYMPIILIGTTGIGTTKQIAAADCSESRGSGGKRSLDYRCFEAEVFEPPDHSLANSQRD
jgi:hypothetical protein